MLQTSSDIFYDRANESIPAGDQRCQPVRCERILDEDLVPHLLDRLRSLCFIFAASHRGLAVWGREGEPPDQRESQAEAAGRRCEYRRHWSLSLNLSDVLEAFRLRKVYTEISQCDAWLCCSSWSIYWSRRRNRGRIWRGAEGSWKETVGTRWTIWLKWARWEPVWRRSSRSELQC